VAWGKSTKSLWGGLEMISGMFLWGYNLWYNGMLAMFDWTILFKYMIYKGPQEIKIAEWRVICWRFDLINHSVKASDSPQLMKHVLIRPLIMRNAIKKVHDLSRKKCKSEVE
jgi:hypothetical protein